VVIADVSLESIAEAAKIGGGTAATIVILYLVVYVVKVLGPAAGNKLVGFGDRVMTLVDQMDSRHDRRLEAMTAAFDSLATTQREQCDRHQRETTRLIVALGGKEDERHQETRHEVKGIQTLLYMHLGIEADDPRMAALMAVMKRPGKQPNSP
jgi:hypothetical protein